MDLPEVLSVTCDKCHIILGAPEKTGCHSDFPTVSHLARPLGTQPTRDTRSEPFCECQHRGSLWHVLEVSVLGGLLGMKYDQHAPIPGLGECFQRPSWVRRGRGTPQCRSPGSLGWLERAWGVRSDPSLGTWLLGFCDRLRGRSGILLGSFLGVMPFTGPYRWRRMFFCGLGFWGGDGNKLRVISFVVLWKCCYGVPE